MRAPAEGDAARVTRARAHTCAFFFFLPLAGRKRILLSMNPDLSLLPVPPGIPTWSATTRRGGERNRLNINYSNNGLNSNENNVINVLIIRIAGLT